MWSRVVTVVLVSYLVSSAIALADLEDNVMPEDGLQDLFMRAKKSPAEDNEKTSSQPESKSDLELKAVLTKDIKRKIEDLKELKNAYRKVETDFFGPESQALKSPNEKISSESKAPLQVSSSGSDDESVRIARQFFPSTYSDKQYSNQQYDSQHSMVPGFAYSNGNSQAASSHSLDSSGDRDAPYIAQYNPSSRTFGLGGIKGALQFQTDLQDALKVPDIKQEVSIHTPVELTHPSIPVHSEPSPVHLVLPVSVPTVTVSEHKPHEEATKPESKVPLYYEKKEIGTPESFFSKQVIYGPSKAFDEKNSYPPYAPYPPYPQGYTYGGSPYSYWYAADRDGYSSPVYDSQPNNNYGPSYWPGYSYQQGHAYYPASRNHRSDRELSDKFQEYQGELDSLISNFFRSNSDGGKLNSPAFENHSSIEQLKEDIDKEQKKIQTLQEELRTPTGSSDGSSISQSFVNWLSQEIDAVYSRWVHLKDDITKTKKEAEVNTKEDLKIENVKV